MVQFYKLYDGFLEVWEQSAILSVIVAMAKGKKEVYIQQTWLAEKFGIKDRGKLTRALKKLVAARLIKMEALPNTTRFELTDKLLNMIGYDEAKKQPTTPKKSKKPRTTKSKAQSDICCSSNTLTTTSAPSECGEVDDIVEEFNIK